MNTPPAVIRTVEWGECYVVAKFKLTHLNSRFAGMGLVTVEEFRKDFLRSQFLLKHTERAVSQLASEQKLDCYYVFGDTAIQEEDYKSRQTYHKIASGEIFDRETGMKYNLAQMERKFAIPQSKLKELEEDDEANEPLFSSWVRRLFRRGHSE